MSPIHLGLKISDMSKGLPGQVSNYQCRSIKYVFDMDMTPSKYRCYIRPKFIWLEKNMVVL